MTQEQPSFGEIRAARWLALARRDAAVAADLAARGELEVAVFCLQQSAEKAIKAVLVAAGAPFERTHNLDRLLLRAAKVDQTYLDCPGEPDRVSNFATQFRYPHDDGIDFATADDVRAASLVAGWLLARAEERLELRVRALADRIESERRGRSG